MSDTNDSIDYDSEKSRRSFTEYKRKFYKRPAGWDKESGVKKSRYYRRSLSDSSDEELPLPSSRRYSHHGPQISSEGNGEHSQNYVSKSSDDIQNNHRHCTVRFIKSPSDYKMLLLDYEQPRSNDKSLFSNNRSENDPVIPGTLPSDLSKKLKSPRNLQPSVRVGHATDNLPGQIKSNHEQDEPNSADSSDASSTEESSSKPSYVFQNLFCADSNNEAEEFSCNWKIFHSNLPMDVLTEEQFLLRNIKKVFKKARKSKGSINQTEALNIPQTLNKDESQNIVDKDTKKCFDWDKFLDRWEGERTISDSTLDAQHHEKTKEDDEVCPPVNSTCTGAAKSSEKKETFKSSSLAEELKMIIHPVLPDISESDVESENYIKNLKIELPDHHTTPFLKNFISPNVTDFSSRGNGIQPHDSDFNFDPLNLKNIINSFKKNFTFDKNVSGDANNSTDKMKKLLSTPVRCKLPVNEI